MVVVLTLVAILGGVLTMVAVWPWGLPAALVCAPIGGSLAVAIAAALLALRNRLHDGTDSQPQDDGARPAGDSARGPADPQDPPQQRCRYAGEGESAGPAPGRASRRQGRSGASPADADLNFRACRDAPHPSAAG